MMKRIKQFIVPFYGLILLGLMSLSTGLHGQEIYPVFQQEENRFVESAHKQSFCQQYGSRNITIVVDEQYLESVFPYTAMSGIFLPKMLYDYSGVVVASLPVVQQMLENKAYDNIYEYWSIFQHSSGAVVFIPKILEIHEAKRYESFGIDLCSCSKINAIKSLKSSKCLNIVKFAAHLFMPARPGVLSAVKNILIPHQRNPWTVILTGHGSSESFIEEGSICGLSASVFKQFLNYLNEKISVKCVAYDTCYGGNKKNRDYLFGTMQYKFPIFSSAFDNTSSIASWSQSGKQFHKAMCLLPLPLEKKDSTKIEKALNELFRFDEYFCNRIQVRWANATQFEPLYGEIVQAAQLDSQNNQFLIKGKNLSVLDQSYYSDVKILGDSPKIAMGTQHDTCVIDTLRLPEIECLPSDFIEKMFVKLSDGNVHKTIIIKNVKSCSGAILLNNVVIELRCTSVIFCQKDSFFMYYMCNNESFSYDSAKKETVKIVDQRTINYYRDIVSKKTLPTDMLKTISQNAKSVNILIPFLVGSIPVGIVSLLELWFKKK